jgi:hypothetical protein
MKPDWILIADASRAELKRQLGDAAQRILAGAHDVDLTAVGPAEIGRRIERELAQAR